VPVPTKLCSEAVTADISNTTDLQGFAPTRNKRTEVRRRGHQFIRERCRNFTFHIYDKNSSEWRSERMNFPNLVMSTETSAQAI
jgi:hypothetical protein